VLATSTTISVHRNLGARSDEYHRRARRVRQPDAALQGRPIVGLQILDDLKPATAEDGTWAGGSIYDPTSGRTYRCTMRLDGSDRLRARGFFVKPRYLLPLAGYVLPAVAIGYGVVIPRSCIAGVNELTIGFASAIAGAVVTYWLGVRAALRDVGRS
jgi:hypothetical protein